MNDVATPGVASIVPTVLVVEHDVIVRMAVSGYLRECGFKVIEAADSDEARRILESDVEIDVVFAEVALPGASDGFALATWLRSHHPRIKVLLTSGIGRLAEQAGNLCEEGPILAKPYDHRELERLIRRLIAAEQHQPR
ncbi:Response regulator receiver domain-containing protein [Enhydrobacter aerosaccus]|uniref:Response regulator receiver domain-containing protein n=1 Tax=Enhydrobacter aerosaccus TaxID=225324 RepID=A0A1T4NI93_9HYPH|nr:response regulator [Enhydrobacter aerosaccus]SJZ78972.1 Response regulator receiver domain-containing protein [Enhydrobacter aerosaccus]